MRIWAIADLHLSFGVKNKSMDYFGPSWAGHAEKIAENWRSVIGPDDLVLIPGDISWALKLEDAVADLLWIHDLPGTKVLLKGNHDYWWGSLSKTVKVLPPSIHLVQNNAFHWKEASVGGARLWDTPEYSFGAFVEYRENPRENNDPDVKIQKNLAEQLFERELQRLEMSLKNLKPEAKVRIAMTHYPPIGADLAHSRASEILEKHGIDVCVFGHLHNIKADVSLFGVARGIRYELTSCDYLRFHPLCLWKST
jgi:predicted phosphohydrolase